ncbi:MAG TPA: DUF433 domain-containing protein [Phycisphaerae bacterium]|nr:DUF433 domain-containing protein [Phycisphaerae bacterium]
MKKIPVYARLARYTSSRSQSPPIPVDKSHITRTPGICGGKPCVAGTRIRVQDIYIWHERQGLSPDEILHQFPSLTLADVYAALAYFWNNRDAVLQDMANEEAVVKNYRRNDPSLRHEFLPQRR